MEEHVASEGAVVMAPGLAEEGPEEAAWEVVMARVVVVMEAVAAVEVEEMVKVRLVTVAAMVAIVEARTAAAAVVVGT